MANAKKIKSSSATIGFEQQIWDAACELWGHIPAADYRKIFTGLIFLKYISTEFEKKYKELVEEGDGFEDDPDAYEADNIFFVLPEARWNEIAKVAHTPEIGTILDKAMIAIEADNKSLKGVLPKNYANPELDKRVLGNVVDVFTNMDMSDTEASKDLLGRTYEYCIAQFSSYEGVKGGEFYTPASVVKTIVNILKPSEGKRVYDPCCGSGGMFVQSVKFIQEHAGNRSNISVFGQEANADTWKMAKMNMAIRGIDANFGGSPGRYLFQRPSFHAVVRLNHGKSALQLKQLGAGFIAERPAMGARTSTSRQRKLRLDRTHDLPPGSKRKNWPCTCKRRPFHPD